MVNPTDRSTVQALIEYRHQQIAEDLRPPLSEIEPDVVVADARYVRPVRRSLGLSLMRIGARLAGVEFRPRPGF